MAKKQTAIRSGANKATPGQVLNIAFSQLDKARQTQVLKALEVVLPQVSVTCHADAATALKSDKTKPALVLAARPAETLAVLLAAGQAPADALETWKTEMEAFLTQCRRNRRRLVVMDAGALASGAPDCLAKLNERFGVNGAAPKAAQAPEALAGPLHQMLAAFALRADADAWALAGELQAMMIGAGRSDDDGLAETEAAAAQLQQTQNDAAQLGQTLTEAQARLTRLEGELGASTKQAAAVQHMLDGQSSRAEGAEQEAGLLRASLAAVTGQLTEVQAGRQALSQSYDALQADHAQAAAQASALEAEAGLLRETLKATATELERSKVAAAAQSEEAASQAAAAQTRLSALDEECGLLRGTLKDTVAQVQAMQADRGAAEKALLTQTGLLRENLQLQMEQGAQARAAEAEAAANLDATSQETALLRTALQQANTAFQKADTARSTAQTEGAALRKTLAEAQAAAARSETRLRGLLKAATTEQARLTDQLAASQTQSGTAQADLTEERDLLQQSLQAMVQQTAGLSGRVQTLDQERSALQTQLTDLHLLRATNAALERRLVQAGTRQTARDAVVGEVVLDATMAHRLALAELEQKSAALEAGQEEAKRLGRETARKTKAQAKRLAAAEADLARTQQEMSAALEEKDGHIAELSGELDRIYSSKSWKLTEPMRSARSRMSGDKP